MKNVISQLLKKNKPMTALTPFLLIDFLRGVVITFLRREMGTSSSDSSSASAFFRRSRFEGSPLSSTSSSTLSYAAFEDFLPPFLTGFSSSEELGLWSRRGVEVRTDFRLRALVETPFPLSRRVSASLRLMLRFLFPLGTDN